MPWEAAITFVIIALAFYAMARNLAGPDILLLGAAVALVSLHAVSDRFPRPGDLAAAFGNEGLLTVGVLFVVAAGLTETGGMAVLSQRVLGRPRSSLNAQVRLMGPVMAMSAFMNNTPIVAMFVPVVREWCRRYDLSPSRLFIPLSYAAILGGLCTLIGTSTNLVVQGLMIQAQRTDPAMPTMGMFTITPIGLAVAFVGGLFLLILTPRILPERRPLRSIDADPKQYTFEMLVQPRSAIDGLTIEEAGLRHLPGSYLAAVERNGARLVAVGPEQRLQGHDVLEFVGIVDSVADLKRIRGLVPATDQVNKIRAPQHDRRLIEAVISNTSPLVGQSIRQAQFRTRYDAAVIAVHRGGERLNEKIGDIVLRPGDTLLLEGHPRFATRHRHSREFLLVSTVADSRPTRHERGWIAVAILGGMVAVVAAESYTGVSVFNGALIAAGLMGLTRCCTAEQARRSIDLSVLVAIAAALAVGKAMETTGLADTMAGALITAAQPFGPWGVLAGVYVFTLLATEFVTNNAAAALAFPVAHAAAVDLSVSFMPYAIVICIAASAGFATPLGYQTHLMVYGPGGYRLTDFVRAGIPLDIVAMVVTVVLAPLVFPF